MMRQCEPGLRAEAGRTYWDPDLTYCRDGGAVEPAINPSVRLVAAAGLEWEGLVQG